MKWFGAYTEQRNLVGYVSKFSELMYNRNKDICNN
uniref:Uncharacterized protein n=1 Tax=Arundo donax TaxID=35708 RepID=A0A0A9GLD2_ARUDO